VLSGFGLAPAQASPGEKEILVRCDSGGKIGRALAKLDKARPGVVKVSGTCQENVVISGFADLRIVGKPGATLLPVPPQTAYAIEVVGSQTVSIEDLTIRQTGDRVAMSLGTCGDCRLKNVVVDGGVGFYAFEGSHVRVSGLTVTGDGGWTAMGAWHAGLYIEDSAFDGGGTETTTRWCGLCMGENATAAVFRSTFEGFGVGIGVDSGAHAQILDHTTIQENWCFGLQVTNGGHAVVQQSSSILGNAFTCWTGGINVDGNATLVVAQNQATGEVRIAGNRAGGIRLNHHAFATLGGGTVITDNVDGAGLEVRNASMAVAPSLSNPPQATITISGNQWWDLFCDSLSNINNAAQIIGETQVQCGHLWSGDGPP
jgi:hypothetical protein